MTTSHIINLYFLQSLWVPKIFRKIITFLFFRVRTFCVIFLTLFKILIFFYWFFNFWVFAIIFYLIEHIIFWYHLLDINFIKWRLILYIVLLTLNKWPRNTAILFFFWVLLNIKSSIELHFKPQLRHIKIFLWINDFITDM